MSTVVSDLVSYLQCGSSISLNDAVYIDSATGKVFKFDPTNSALLFAGIAKEAGVLNDYIRIVQSGRVKGFAGLTVGALVYASVVTPGSFQLTVPPSSQSVILGIAKSATELVINGALGIKPGGSASGSGVSLVNSLLTQSLEAATLADFTQTGLSLSTSNPINGSVSAQLIHQAVTTQSFKQVIAVNNKFKGYSNTLSLSVRSSALAANLTLLVRDETNSVNLLASTQVTTGQITSAVFNTATSTTVTVTDNSILNQLKVGASITGSGIATGTVITAVGSSGVTISQAATATATGVSLKVSLLPATQSFSFPIPTNCSSISYTISALAEAGLPETYIDDVLIQLSSTSATSASITQTTFNATSVAPYTPAITGCGTVTNNVAEWKQNGDVIEIKGSFTTGTPTAALVSLTLPNSFALDSTKISLSNTTANSGPSLGDFYAQATNGFGSVVSALGTSTSLVYLANLTVNSTNTIPQNGSAILGATQNVTYKFSFPAAGLTAMSTTTQTIPLSSSVIVTQPDSYLKVSTAIGYGSTGTTTLRFSNIVASVGSDVQYISDSINGDRFVILKEGSYSVNLDYASATNSDFGISINSSSTSTSIQSIPEAQKLVQSTQQTVNYVDNASTTAYLYVGDILRCQTDAGAISSSRITRFTITKIGSTKIINPSSDQKIEIPTHELRFEGASSRGATDTAIVKFDTMPKIKGDGFTVVNTTANGTVVTIKKAGMLSVSTSLVLSSGSSRMGISVNQSVLTSVAVASEIRASDFSSSVTTGASATSSFPVNIGDVVRIFAGSAITLDAINNLSLSLQEQTVAVALQNVLPTFDQSDSCVQLRTANGYGSTNTKIRRFSNTVQNFGTDITYVDDASLGGSFTVNKDGVYNISYTDLFASVQNMGITKNSAELTTSVQTLTVPSSILTAVVTPAANYSATASTSVYLIKGDVIRAHTTGVASGTDVSFEAKFTISKVGKTSGTVDVTPFVQIPTQDVEAIEALTATSTFGSTNTGVPVLNITKNTNKGIIQVVSDSVNGTSFKALKDCTVNFSSSAFNSTSTSTFYITKNATVLTATTPDGIISNISNAGGGYGSTQVSITMLAGDILRTQRNSTFTTSWTAVELTATATSTSIVTPTQQVSSDTMSFAFQATALTGSEAIGTFNTYTYAASTNTATISATAPTQTTSSMNANGVQVFARAYSALSTAASPSRVDIVISKGLKAKQVDAYASLAKAAGSEVNYDFRSITAALTNLDGTDIVYNELTGILSINAATDSSAASTNRGVGITPNNATAQSSAYFVFNASKIPSLASLPNLQPRIAYLSDVKVGGATTSGASTGGVYQTRVLNTLVDNTGIVGGLASNQFILPTGTYDISASAPCYNGNVHKIRLRNITDSTTALIGTKEYITGSVQTNSLLFGQITITSTKTFELQHWIATSAVDGLGISNASGGDDNIFSAIKITKIK
jgi:hypothetical protein